MRLSTDSGKSIHMNSINISDLLKITLMIPKIRFTITPLYIMLLLEYTPMLLQTVGCYSDESAMEQVVPETL